MDARTAVAAGGTLRVTMPAPREDWRELVASTPEALAFQTPEWLDCVCSLGAYRDSSRLYVTPAGGRLLVPLLRRTAAPARWAPQASLPYGWGFGGVLQSPDTVDGDLRMVLADLARQSAVRVSIRPNPMTAGEWPEAVPPEAVRVPRRAHVLELDGDFESVFATRFKGRARTAIRRAERASLTVERDTSGRLVPVFHAIYRRSLERWASSSPLPDGVAYRLGVRRDPLEKFVKVAEAMGDGCRVWVAYHEGRPAAALICLVQGKVASYWRGCVDVDLAERTYASYLLQRAAIEDACLSGCTHYHMGETGSSASLAQFKRAFGADAYDYAEYRFERVPLTPASRRLRSLLRR